MKSIFKIYVLFSSTLADDIQPVYQDLGVWISLFTFLNSIKFQYLPDAQIHQAKGQC